MITKILKEKFIFSNKILDKTKIILLLSQIFSALSSVILGKIIAVHFLPEEFGQYNLQLATYFFFLSLFINPFLQYMKSVTNSNLFCSGFAYLKKIGLLLLITTLLMVVLTLKVYYNTNIYILGLFFLIVPFNFLYNLLLDYLNVKGNIIAFSWSSIFNSLFGLLFLIASVYYFHITKYNVLLLWLLLLVGYLGGIIFFIRKYKIPAKTNSEENFYTFLQIYWKFSWPLMLLAFLSWLNTYFDRYLIEYFLNLKEVGIYNANMGLGSKVFLMLNPFFLALLTPVAFNDAINIDVKKQQINKYALFYTLIALLLLLFLGFTYKLIGSILLSENYSSGNHIIFWSAVAYFFITFTYLFEIIFYAKKRTKVILVANLVSAVATIVLNFMFIPVLGINGALLSLIVSSILRLVIVLFVFKKL